MAYWDFTPDRFDFMPPEPERYQGLSLADLWTPPAEVQYPEAPSPINDPSQLDEAQKKALRRQAILLVAQAFGHASTNGQLGTALAGAAGAFEDQRMQAVSDAQGRQQAAYQAARQQAELTARNADLHAKSNLERSRAEGTLALVRQIAEGEPAMAGQAEMLARTGDLDGLRKLAAEVPHRQAMRRLGLDPDDPVAIDLYKQKQLDEQKIAQEQRLKELGLDYIRQKEEIEGQVRAKYRAPEGEAGIKPRLGQAPDGTWGLLKPQADGSVQFLPVAGQPQKHGSYEIMKVKDPASGKEEFYSIDRQHPELGAKIVPRPEKPKPAEEPGILDRLFGGGEKKKPAPPKAPQAPKSPQAKGGNAEAEIDRKTAAAKARLGAVTPEQEAALRTFFRQKSNASVDEAVARAQKYMRR